MDTRTIVDCIVRSTIDYGCASVFGDLADAVMPYRTKPLKRAIKHFSASILGSYLGGWCADKIMRDFDMITKDILEMAADGEESGVVVNMNGDPNNE